MCSRAEACSAEWCRSSFAVLVNLGKVSERVPGMSSVLKGLYESSARAGREAAWRLVGGRSALPLHVLSSCNCRAEVVQLSHGRRESGSDLYESICRARVRADACLVVPCLRWRHVWRMRVEEAHQASSHTCR